MFLRKRFSAFSLADILLFCADAVISSNKAVPRQKSSFLPKEMDIVMSYLITDY
jgi:hypothetical protein